MSDALESEVMAWMDKHFPPTQRSTVDIWAVRALTAELQVDKLTARIAELERINLELDREQQRAVERYNDLLKEMGI